MTPYSSVEALTSWILRQDGRARPVEPDELRRRTAAALRKVREAHESDNADARRSPSCARATVRRTGQRARSSPAFPASSVPCWPTLPPAAATPARPRSAAELVEEHIPEDQLREPLSLLSLVNFGGGLRGLRRLQGDVVRVDKELYGDAFRAPPRRRRSRRARSRSRSASGR